MTRGYLDAPPRRSQSESGGRECWGWGWMAGRAPASKVSSEAAEVSWVLETQDSFRLGDRVAKPSAGGAAFMAAPCPTGNLFRSWVLPVTLVTLNKSPSCRPCDPSGKCVVPQGNQIKLELCKSAFLDY